MFVSAFLSGWWLGLDVSIPMFSFQIIIIMIITIISLSFFCCCSTFSVCGVAFLAHVLTTGFQLSYGLLYTFAEKHLRTQLEKDIMSSKNQSDQSIATETSKFMFVFADFVSYLLYLYNRYPPHTHSRLDTKNFVVLGFMYI